MPETSAVQSAAMESLRASRDSAIESEDSLLTASRIARRVMSELTAIYLSFCDIVENGGAVPIGDAQRFSDLCVDAFELMDAIIYDWQEQRDPIFQVSGVFITPLELQKHPEWPNKGLYYMAYASQRVYEMWRDTEEPSWLIPART